VNVAAAVLAAFRRTPKRLRGCVVFTDTSTEATAKGEATGGPPGSRGTGANANEFAAGVTMRQQHRILSVLPAGLAFAPREGMVASWEGEDWHVMGVSPVAPGGTPLLYRVSLGR
jgi:hypothetical protein